MGVILLKHVVNSALTLTVGIAHTDPDVGLTTGVHFAINSDTGHSIAVKHCM